MKIFMGKLPPDDSYKVVGFRHHLDDVCENNECEEINASNMLDFVAYAKHKEFILHLISKLRHGGKLIIGGTDLISLSLNTFNKNLSTEKVNELLFGSTDQPVKIGITCLEHVRNIVLSTELRITKQICELNFILEAVRP